jgi:hypothetical protein
MPPLPTPEEWAQIRHEYENTRRSIEDICLAYRNRPNTLRRRVKSWGWTMRRPPISDEGPEPVRPPEDIAAAELRAPDPRLRGGERGESAEPCSEPSRHIAEPPDPRPASERLQGAATRVMQAIETTSARLTARPVHLREAEMAARALGSLTRVLGELNELLRRHPVQAADDPPPEDMDEFRTELARRLESVIERHETQIPAKYEAAWHEFAAEAKRASPEAATASI